jgi:hypothetical protein
MKEKVFFTEKQFFSRFWLLFIALVFAGAFSIFAYIWYDYIYACEVPCRKTIDRSMFYLIVIVTFITFLITGLLIFRANLKTKVTSNGIFYSFFPFQLKEKQIALEDIESYEVRDYNPILEYGGWGVRKSFRGKGKAYNPCGKVGMQLVLRNGKKILFGTGKGTEFTKALESALKG